MAEFQTKSGATVVITIASWEDAKRLKAAIEREAAKAGIKLDMEAEAELLLSALLLIDSSDAVDAAMWPCLARCLHNGQKITPKTFDTAAARADYYEIMQACMTENFAPLFESLLSVLPPGLLAAIKGEQKSPSDSPASA